jgi:hypothetical protein
MFKLTKQLSIPDKYFPMFGNQLDRFISIYIFMAKPLYTIYIFM